jgi:hypothetical protein
VVLENTNGVVTVKQTIIIIILSLFKKIKVGFWDHHAVCVRAFQFFNAWTNPCEFWYVYHGTWGLLNRVGLIHKSLPSVCVSECLSLLSLVGNGSVNSIPPYVAKQRLGKHVPVAMIILNKEELLDSSFFFFCGPYRIKGKEEISSS